MKEVIKISKFREWSIYILLITLAITMFIIGVTFALRITDLYNSAMVSGLIGFLGAIIGGSLTLIGVRYTILEQRKQDEVSKLPERIVETWQLSEELSHLVWLKHIAKENLSINENQVIRNFEKERMWDLTHKATRVSPRAYRIVNKFFDHVADYDKDFTVEEKEEWYNELYKIHTGLSTLINEYELQYENTY